MALPYSRYLQSGLKSRLQVGMSYLRLLQHAFNELKDEECLDVHAGGGGGDGQWRGDV